MISSYQIDQMAAHAAHETYLKDAATYRSLRAAGASMPTRRISLHLLESLGTMLIGLGRRLCERRGELQVEVAFKHSSLAGHPHGRHVA